MKRKTPSELSRSLTNAQAVEIRKRRSKGEQLQALADAFGVSKTAVQKLVTGQTYCDAGGPITIAQA